MARYEIKPPIDPRERAIDLALLAYILKGAAPFYGRTKLQKTTFLVELDLLRSGFTGPRFRFIRYNNGPFSRGLWDAYDFLHSQGFAKQADQPALTDRGKVLVDYVEELREEANQKFFARLDATLEDCQRRKGAPLMRAVYKIELNVDHQTMKIEDIPIGVDLIVPEGEPSLHVPPDIQRLLVEELELTEERLAKAREQVPTILEEFAHSLLTSSEHRRSA